MQFAYIGDSDDGRWDGDTSYDRAMGPMQFIPTTWRSYAIDADGNGSTDPFNINDAALAAANYLCVAGGDLRTDAGQRRAVLAYNHSDEYVAEVLALAHAYAAGIPVADLPLVGQHERRRSRRRPASSGAPAAPGPAIGARDTTSSPPEQTTGQSPQSAGGGTPSRPGRPASPGGSPAQPAGTNTGTVGGPAPQQGPAPANPGQSPPATSGGSARARARTAAGPPATAPVQPPAAATAATGGPAAAGAARSSRASPAAPSACPSGPNYRSARDAGGGRRTANGSVTSRLGDAKR